MDDLVLMTLMDVIGQLKRIADALERKVDGFTKPWMDTVECRLGRMEDDHEARQKIMRDEIHGRKMMDAKDQQGELNLTRKQEG